MKSLKTVCAVLICFVLVAAQTVFISHAQPAAASQAAESCGCGSCVEMQCCLSQPPVNAPQSAPAPPARTVSQTQLQFVACVVALFTAPPAKASAAIFPAVPLSLPAAEVPLYTWNCSYLI